MSEVNYWLIENRLAQLIRDNLPELGGTPVKVYVEEPLNLITARGQQVYIYLKEWSSPSDEELIGSGKHFRTYLNFEFWLFVHAMESPVGMPLRNRFMQKLKEIFKTPANRKFTGDGIGSVLISRFEGGEFIAPTDDSSMGLWYGVTMKLQAEVRE